MMSTFIPHLHTLPTAQQNLWPLLKPARELGFVLYGGTAIALRLGHRISVDFDFFTEKSLDRTAMTAVMPFLTQATVIQDSTDSLSMLVPSLNDQHVKISFFGSIRFGRVGTPDTTQDHTLLVASLADLMATKVKVILQRAEAKDYRDIAAMIPAGADLAHGLAAAREMFGPNFQPSESLKALVYFNDGDLPTLTQTEKSILIQAVSQIRDLPTVNIRAQTLSSENKGF